jgi:hypothetical protein
MRININKCFISHRIKTKMSQKIIINIALFREINKNNYIIRPPALQDILFHPHIKMSRIIKIINIRLIIYRIRILNSKINRKIIKVLSYCFLIIQIRNLINCNK